MGGRSTVRYRINSPQVINETIDGEEIMINLATGSYYSLDRVGGDVWALLEASVPVDDIVAELGRRYDAGEDDIRRGVADLLQRLSEEELVVPSPNGGPVGRASPAAPTPATRPPFRAPRLEKFTDMQDLILLDPVHEVDSRGWPHLPDGHDAAR
jgi:antitoxin (DNA-binding transcriptional repressor) of toxin-antitoxin stability system